MASFASIPLIPTAVGLGLRPLPLGPLALATDLIARSVARSHAGMFARLGAHANKRFLIDPTDLPFVFVLTPQMDNPSVAVARSGEGLPFDARIAGPIAALVGLVHGAYDGDALFFSRDLVIEGDVEAVLALRNALDDAELATCRGVRDASLKLSPIPCTSCRYGLPCPSGVAIPEVFEVYNEAEIYGGGPAAARFAYGWLSESERAEVCTQCRTCEELCPQKIAIVDWLEKIQQYLAVGN